MSACRYRLVHVSIEPSRDGKPMRRLQFTALPSDPFGSTDGNPVASGSISHLVTEDYAKKFAVGDEFDVMFRERET